MKKRAIAILLALCLCLPLAFASCSGDNTINFSDVYGDDYNVGLVFGGGEVYNQVNKSEFTGRVIIANDNFIVEVSDTVNGESVYRNYSIYRTADMTLQKVITVDADNVGYDSFNALVSCDISLVGDSYLMILTKDLNDYEKITIMGRGGTEIFKAEARSTEFEFYGDNHFVYNEYLYRIENNDTLTQVKNLASSSIVAVLEEAENVSYNYGKYFALMEESVVIYDDKLSNPEVIEFPLEAIEKEDAHGVKGVELDLCKVLCDGSILFQYKRYESINCESHQMSCEEYDAKKANYMLVSGNLGINYELYLLSAQDSVTKKLDYPSFAIDNIYVTQIEEDEKNVFSGYRIKDQEIDKDSTVTGYVLNDGTILTLNIPEDASMILPLSNDRLVGYYEHGTYILNNNFEIVCEVPKDAEFFVDGLIKVGNSLYNLDMEPVHDESGDIPTFMVAGSTRYAYLLAEYLYFYNGSLKLLMANGETAQIDMNGKELISVSSTLIAIAENNGSYYKVSLYNAKGQYLTNYTTKVKPIGVYGSTYDDLFVITNVNAQGKTDVILIRENPSIENGVQEVTQSFNQNDALVPDTDLGGKTEQSTSTGLFGGLLPDPLA